jgi:hypothetical protein
MVSDGALGAASAGGGETVGFIIETCVGLCFSILKAWTSASFGDASKIWEGSVRGVWTLSVDSSFRRLAEVIGEASILV